MGVLGNAHVKRNAVVLSSFDAAIALTAVFSTNRTITKAALAKGGTRGFTFGIQSKRDCVLCRVNMVARIAEVDASQQFSSEKIAGNDEDGERMSGLDAWEDEK